MVVVDGLHLIPLGYPEDKEGQEEEPKLKAGRRRPMLNKCRPMGFLAPDTHPRHYPIKYPFVGRPINNSSTDIVVQDCVQIHSWRNLVIVVLISVHADRHYPFPVYFNHSIIILTMDGDCRGETAVIANLASQLCL